MKRFNNPFDFYGFFEVIELIELMFAHSPGSNIHQQFRIIISVFEERIEGQADVLSVRCDFAVTDFDNFRTMATSQVFLDEFVKERWNFTQRSSALPGPDSSLNGMVSRYRISK